MGAENSLHKIKQKKSIKSNCRALYEKLFITSSMFGRKLFDIHSVFKIHKLNPEVLCCPEEFLSHDIIS